MKVYQFGLMLCIASAIIGYGFGIEYTEVSVIYPEEVQQAVSSCKQGDWYKIDRSTIYCADGAEYKRGE